MWGKKKNYKVWSLEGSYLGKPAHERKNRPVVTYKDHKDCTLFSIELWDNVSQRDRLSLACHLTDNAANEQCCAMPTVIHQHQNTRCLKTRQNVLGWKILSRI